MTHSTPLSPWIPKRQRVLKENIPQAQPPAGSSCPQVTPLQSTIATPSRISSHPTNWDSTPVTPCNPLTLKNTYRNGYSVKPKTPSYTPYKPKPRQKPFAFAGSQRLGPLGPLTADCWNALALEHGLLTRGQQLRDYQVEAANVIIAREKDLCVIAPTGSGKSHLWVLPLLVQKGGISLVIIPYTSLGFQGEQRCVHISFYHRAKLLT